MDSKSSKLRGRLASHARYNPTDTATISELRRDLRAARLEDYILKAVSEAPPLTLEQRSKLALLLQGSATPKQGAAA